MFKRFDDIERVAAAGKPDKVLNQVIMSYLQEKTLFEYYDSQSKLLDGEQILSHPGFYTWLATLRSEPDFTLPEITEAQINEFKLGHYAMFRTGAYPPMAMYLDAEVKGDDDQKAEYVRLCQEVKDRFPKPMES